MTHNPGSRLGRLRELRRASWIAVFLVAWLGSQMFAQEPAWVTVKQLLRTPHEFDGKEVFVFGYFDGSRLFADYGAEQKRAGIAVDQIVFFNPGTRTSPAASIVGVSEPCELKNCYVKVIGTFRCQSVSGQSSCSGQLAHIVLFRRTSRSPATDPRPCGMH